ncbi:MAG TPA: hypothetical protein VMK12_20760 [Anaeromyxobacteraceae bacterium]|nr:hypothetical protein [Anaeromyxobacteraceae bacterium]
MTSNSVAGRPDEGVPGYAELAESWLVSGAVAQGSLLGIWLTAFPSHALRVVGSPTAPAFFVRWVGILQIVLALGCAIDWTRLRRVTLLVATKGATALLLATVWAVDELPTLMMAACLGEALLAICGAALKRPADRSRRSRVRLRLVDRPLAEVRPAGQR